MTLDGHIKTGLAASLFLTALIPTYLKSIGTDISLEILIVFFFLGNVGPDLLEMKIIKHRTYTHFMWFYVAIAGASYCAIEFLGVRESYLYYAIAFSGGSLLHILCDIPYGGIPYFRPTRKVMIMQVPFDSIFNRVIEHSVLIMFLMGYLTIGTDVFQQLAEYISTFKTTPTDFPTITK